MRLCRWPPVGPFRPVRRFAKPPWRCCCTPPHTSQESCACCRGRVGGGGGACGVCGCVCGCECGCVGGGGVNGEKTQPLVICNRQTQFVRPKSRLLTQHTCVNVIGSFSVIFHVRAWVWWDCTVAAMHSVTPSEGKLGPAKALGGLYNQHHIWSLVLPKNVFLALVNVL